MCEQLGINNDGFLTLSKRAAPPGLHGEEPHFCLRLRLRRAPTRRRLHWKREQLLLLHQGQAVSRRLSLGQRRLERCGVPVAGRLPRRAHRPPKGDQAARLGI